jgi:hypothetical protein
METSIERGRTGQDRPVDLEERIQDKRPGRD